MNKNKLGLDEILEFVMSVKNAKQELEGGFTERITYIAKEKELEIKVSKIKQGYFFEDYEYALSAKFDDCSIGTYSAWEKFDKKKHGSICIIKVYELLAKKANNGKEACCSENDYGTKLDGAKALISTMKSKQ